MSSVQVTPELGQDCGGPYDCVVASLALHTLAGHQVRIVYKLFDIYIYRVSHNIGSTLFFAILLSSTLPKYKSRVSIKKFRKFAIR